MPKYVAQIDTSGIPVKTLVYDQGTAFPAGPVEGQHFHRTDLKQTFVYLNGTWERDDTQGVSRVGHTHSTSEVAGLDAALNGKATAGHNHDDRYYTEGEVDQKLGGKADAGHVHDDRYYTEAEIDGKLTAKVDSSTFDYVLGQKANVQHGHVVGDISGLQAVLDGKATPAQVTATVNAAIAAAIDGAPDALNTLKELATALGNDPNFANTILSRLGALDTAVGNRSPLGHGHNITDVVNLSTELATKGKAFTVQTHGAITAGTWTKMATTSQRTMGVSMEAVERGTGDVLILDHRWIVNGESEELWIRTGIAFAANTIIFRYVTTTA